MDEFLFGNVKAEKVNAMGRHKLFAAIAKTLRILELCLALLLLSWILTRLPFALKISGEYFRTLSAIAASPLFVFAVSNAIIAALLAQSGRFTGQDSAGDNADGDGAGLYQEFLKNRNTVTDRAKPPSDAGAPPSATTAEAEYQDKLVISETSTAVDRTVEDRAAAEACTDNDSDSAGADSRFANYRRIQSEKWKGETGKMLRQKLLRRSETEKRRENPRETLYPHDKLSNEEFQRTIEAFIAKQMRFLREESSAIVVQNPS